MPKIVRKPSESFEEHKSKWSNCTACNRSVGCLKKSLYRGTLPCDILFVGDGVSVTESLIGKPFVQSRMLTEELLNFSIKAAKMRNSGSPYEKQLEDLTVGFTTLVSCFPSSGKKDPEKAAVSLEEVKLCYDRFKDILQLSKPKLIVMLGKSVVDSLVNLNAIDPVYLNSVEYCGVFYDENFGCLMCSVQDPRMIDKMPKIYRTMGIDNFIYHFSGILNNAFSEVPF